MVGKNYWMILVCFSVVCSACQRKDERILFEMPYRINFSVNAGLNPFQVHYFQVDNITNQLQGLLQDRGLTLDDLTGIEAGSARMTAEIPDVSYRFIREISVRLYEGDPGNSSDYREMWYRDDSNLLGEDDVVDLIPSLANGLPFLLNDKFNISIVIQLREVTPVTMQNQLDFTFFVK